MIDIIIDIMFFLLVFATLFSFCFMFRKLNMYIAYLGNTRIIEKG